MPHVIIKYFDAPVKETSRKAIADTITRALVESLGCSPKAVSIALRPIAPTDWNETVFVPDISRRTAELIQEPDYTALAESPNVGKEASSK